MMHAKEAAWYDEFYQQLQKQMGAWYHALLPDLRAHLTRETKLLELGCGQGHILRYLVGEGLIPEKNIFAIDQSKTAVEFVKKALPDADIATGDIYKLIYPKDSFDIVLLMETIEHLEEPALALEQIFSVMTPGGLLYLSFPNFLHLPWLLVRI